MVRIAWVMQLKPGNEAIYKQKHDEIWLEMLENMKKDGVETFSIYRYGLTLFAYMERQTPPDPHAPHHPVTLKWWKMMEPYMDYNDDGTPWQASVEEMFHFDNRQG